MPACTEAWSDFVSMQECPTPIDKVVVLEEMIFPQCEKLGQTIIFVRTREIARTLHAAVRSRPPAFIYQTAAGHLMSALNCSGRVHPSQIGGVSGHVRQALSTEPLAPHVCLLMGVSVLQLEKAGHRCTSIRGDLDHQLRDRVVNEFRTGITKILIATDVLSRGFDVTQVRAGCLNMCSQHVPGICLCVFCHVG